MELYASVGRRIRRILDDFSPAIEPLSIDEAFIDLSGIAFDLDAGEAIARRIKARIRDEERLTASVGVAPNKFLAKVASDLDKPDGLVRLGPAEIASRLWPLPVERLWGVGPRTAERLREGGLRTVGDLVRVDEAALAALVGANRAAHLAALARGEDARPIEARRPARSISEERTYGEDLTDPQAIDLAILARADGLARQLRAERLVARTVHLKVRIADFTTWTRASTLGSPTDLAEPIAAAARELLASRVPLAGRGVRLLGVSVSGLVSAERGQLGLFGEGEARARRLARAADALRDRLGEHAVVRARLLGSTSDRPIDSTRRRLVERHPRQPRRDVPPR
jgi:DNA polymerase-4